MAFASSSNQEVYYVREASTFGKVKNKHQWRLVGVTSESLVHDREVTQSQTIVANRQVRDLIPTTFGSSGNFECEMEVLSGDWRADPLVEGSYDGLILGALCADTNGLGGAEGIHKKVTVVFRNNNVIQLTNEKDLVLEHGGLFRIDLPGNRDPKGGYIATVGSTAVNGNNLELTYIDPWSSIPNSGGGNNADLTYDYARGGKEVKTFMIEKFFTDINVGMRYTGMFVNQFSLNLEGNAAIRATFDFLGVSGEATSVRPAFSTQGVPANAYLNSTSKKLNNADHVAYLINNSGSEHVNSLTFTINNNGRQQRALGTREAIGIGLGQQEVTGTLNMYFETVARYQQFLDNSEQALGFAIGADNRWMQFYMPCVKFLNAPANVGGNNQDVFIDLEFQAISCPVNGYALGVSRV